MAEYPSRPTDADNIGWRTNAAGNPVTDPGASVRADGWAVNAIPGSDEFNYIQKLIGDFLQWLEDGNLRRWGDVSEGIAAATVRDLFRTVGPAGDELLERLTEAFTLPGTASTGGNPLDFATDGEQLYYIAGSVAQTVVAASPLNNAEIWEAGGGVVQFFSIDADGQYLYATADSGSPGLRRLDRATGATAGAGGTEYACAELRTNGEFAVGIAPATSGSRVVFWTVATPTQTGTVDIQPLAGLAIDHDSCYVGGTRTVTNDVYSLDLQTRAINWQVQLDSTAAVINSIAADGNFVYVGTTDFTTSKGTNACIFCLERVSGAVLWEQDLGVDILQLEVDGSYLYAVGTGDVCYMIRLGGETGLIANRHVFPGVVTTQTKVDRTVRIVCTGDAVYCRDSPTPANVRKLWVGGAAKTFYRVSGDQPNRRPFFNLAIPISRNL